MKYKSILLTSLLGLGLVSAQAQTEFYLNGYGRSIITSNSLSADQATASTVKKSVGGYALFDLTTNFKMSNTLWANTILRVKSPFGGFFGTGVQLGFRQFQVGGRIGKFVKYEFGDINIGEGMGPYAVYNFDDMYTRFESPLLAQRRDILTYENFNTGNLWRLQGVQANAKFSIGSAVDTLKVYGFAARTNSTNDGSIPDRILSGGRLTAVLNPAFKLGGNYVGLLDVPVNTSEMVYSNHVLSGDANLNLPLGEDIIAHAGLNTGLSSYSNKSKTLDTTISYSDFYYEGAVGATYKPVKLKLMGTLRNVGPQYSSPTAQTRRVNNTISTSLFGNINSNVVRTQSLFDRYTQEDAYNRVILPTLQQFNPIYSNIFPYGTATPNRTGFTIGLSTDTSAKIIDAEIAFDSYKQIIGEGTVALKNYTGIKGGVSFNIGKFIASERNYIIQAGYRSESTTRDGNSKVDLASTVIDLGASVEALKRVDILGGVKMFNAKGNDYITKYDQFNMVSEVPSVLNNVDMAEMVYSIGFKYRISDNGSLFTINYNKSDVKTTSKVGIDQLFINFIAKF